MNRPGDCDMGFIPTKITLKWAFRVTHYLANRGGLYSLHWIVMKRRNFLIIQAAVRVTDPFGSSGNESNTMEFDRPSILEND